MASDWRTSFPVVGAVLDAAGNVVLNDITETVPIREGYAKLTQVPYKDAKVDNNVTIQGFSEIDSGAPKPAEFRVNYTTGRVYFDASANGTVVSVTYKGKGTLVGIDEINWLWENVTRATENLFYVSLNDTPSVLIPRAVQVVDKTGTRIEQMSPEIGRSYCDTQLLLNFAGTYNFQGSIFDWITVWKLTVGSTTTDTKDISAGFADNLTLSAGVYSASGAAGHFYSSEPLFYADSYKLTKISFPAINGSVNALFAISGVYYSFKNGDWTKIGTLNSAKNLAFADWNTMAEINAIPQDKLSMLTGAPVTVAFFAAAGSSFTPSISIVYNSGFSYEKADFGAAFDPSSQSWTLTMTAGYDYAVIVGSGKDDISCTSEVVEFTDVLPGETVRVAAPVRTNVNVLVGDTRTNTTYAFPPESRGWGVADGSSDYKISAQVMPDVACGCCYSESDWLSMFEGVSRTGTDVGYAYGTNGKNNTLKAGYEPVAGQGALVPGEAGPAALVYDATTSLKMAATSAKSIYYGSASAVFNVTLGCAFKVLSGTQMLITSDNNWTLVPTLQIYADANNLYISRHGYVVTVPIVKDSFNYLVVKNIKVNVWDSGSMATSQNVDVILNGKVVLNTASSSRNYSPTSGGTVYEPNIIGRNSSNTTYTGSVIIEHPFRLGVSVTDAQAIDISNAMAALTAGKRALYTGKALAVSTTKFLEGVSLSNYATISEPAQYAKMPTKTYYGFFNGYEILTIDRSTLQVVTTSKFDTYSDILRYWADINTLKSSSAIIKSGTFSKCYLVAASVDYGKGSTINGNPGQLIASLPNTITTMRMATTSDAKVEYVNGEWKVTNKTSITNKFRLAILGGGLNGGDGNAADTVNLFIQLLDTPSDLNDVAPKALVSHNGAVEKALRVHPYLLGGI